MTYKLPFLVLNGPNLNFLGKRDPRYYGTVTLAEIFNLCEATAAQDNRGILKYQSNSEGKLIDWLQESYGEVAGIVINPGGLTHTSVALRDALEIFTVPKVEVHLSNIFAREDFRSNSFLSPVVDAVISGLGELGYQAAIRYLIATNKKCEKEKNVEQD